MMLSKKDLKDLYKTNPCLKIHRTCKKCWVEKEIIVKAADYRLYISKKKTAAEAFTYLKSGMIDMLISGLCPECQNNLLEESHNEELYHLMVS